VKRSPAVAPRRSRLLHPLVWAPILLLLLALGTMLWQWQSERAEVQKQRELLLAQVLSATTRAEPDTSELSRLTALLAKYPDRETAADLLAAGARIELARNRPERAQALFGNRAAGPTATPQERGLGAEILIQLHAAGQADVATATGMLRQAEAFAERAFDASDNSQDLLRAWQAASRLQDQAAVARHAARLAQAAPESPAAGLAQLAAQFEPTMPLADLEALRAQFVVPPPELEAMRVLVMAQAGDLRAAAGAAEALLLRAPGVLAVRWAVALVFHACVVAEPAGSGTRGQWFERRNHQLDWLLQHAPVDDGRRAQWDQMRTQR
jgi:hypothetical protein